jgi:hypothetical protein
VTVRITLMCIGTVHLNIYVNNNNYYQFGKPCTYYGSQNKTVGVLLRFSREQHQQKDEIIAGSLITMGERSGFFSCCQINIQDVR